MTAEANRRTLRLAMQVAAWILWMLSAMARADELVWHSGFENGFPGGEWLDWDGGSYSANGTVPAGRVSAWTIVDRQSGEPVFAGNRAYKGWIVGAATDSHRAYPVIHTDIETPLVNTFMVYLDTDYGRMSRTDWIHLGTWGNNDPVTRTGIWALHTLAVGGDGKLGFAHTSPFSGEYIGPASRPDFPLRKWVRITMYIIYQGTTGFVQAWQDGTPMYRARVSKLEKFPGTRLLTAHWGMYANKATYQGVQYNDEIRICTLDVPLADLRREPGCAPMPSPRSSPAR